MADTNLSLVLHGIKDVRLEEKPIPEPGPREVQLSIRSVGLCGSDVSFWQKGRIGNQFVTSATILGHEPGGVITKLGSEVTNLKVGDRVAVEPNRPCGMCKSCKRGKYNLCENRRYLAVPPQDGCLTRLFCHPAAFVHKLPDNVSFDEAALCQPLALGFYACERGHVTVGSYLLITGAGPLGMAVVLAAKAFGASKVCVTDIIEDRLEFIRKIGADVTVCARTDEDPEETSRRVVESLGRETDVTIECSGSETAISTAIYSTAPGGVVVQVGLSGPLVQIPLVRAVIKELSIVGNAALRNNYEAVIEAISTGRVNAKQLVTHRYPLEQAVEALEAVMNRQGVKVVVDCEKKQ